MRGLAGRLAGRLAQSLNELELSSGKKKHFHNHYTVSLGDTGVDLLVSIS